MCSAICIEIVPCLPLLFDFLLITFAVYMATVLIAINCRWKLNCYYHLFFTVTQLYSCFLLTGNSENKDGEILKTPITDLLEGKWSDGKIDHGSSDLRQETLSPLYKTVYTWNFAIWLHIELVIRVEKHLSRSAGCPKHTHTYWFWLKRLTVLLWFKTILNCVSVRKISFVFILSSCKAKWPAKAWCLEIVSFSNWTLTV